MATLKQVGQAAGVSVATAARVLRGDPSLSVRSETRQRVLEAADRLGYRPNRLASGLRTRRTGTLAVFLPDPQNIMWGAMIRGIEHAAAELEYVVVVADAHGPALDHDQYGRFVLEGRVDALLVAFARIGDELVAQIADRGLPLLPINSRSDIVGGSVTMDDEAGSRLAVEYLASLGHRRIAFVAGRSDTDVGRRREAGYRNAMVALGLSIDPGWVQEGDYTVRSGRTCARALWELPANRRPTAVYAVNLLEALGVRAATGEADLRIPEDVSMVTMDDHFVLDHTDPPLTAVRMPMEEMGVSGARMLIEAVDGRPIRHLTVPTKPRLIVRASTSPPASS